mgnify:CR=1 FL=1|tara:strand:+ start:279 stop:1214 length:936 start_codon:yes stop_codon:yes gene_type:complete
MKHIKLLLSISILFISVHSHCQIFKNKSVFITAGFDFETNFLVKDSISIDSTKTDTIYYSLHRETIKGDFRSNFNTCKLTEIQEKLFVSLVTNVGDTISQSLLYDFSLMEGDIFTISIPKYGVSESFEVNAISMFFLQNGDTVNSQVFNDLWEYFPLDKHLPAIGSNVGPLGLFQYVLNRAVAQDMGLEMRLISACVHDTLLFFDPTTVSDTSNIDWCNSKILIDRLLASTNEPTENKLKLYPNPSSSQLYISGIDESVNFLIYDSFGKGISTGFTSYSIDISDLQEGLYFIQITNTKTNHYETHKIIIER